MERAAPRSPIWPCTRWGFPCLRACAWSGGLLPRHFTLTQPFLKPAVAMQHKPIARTKLLRRLRPAASGKAGRYVFCGTIRQDASRHHCPRVSVRRLLASATASYAASRPLVFGLSSPPNLSGGAILRPSKTTSKVPHAMRGSS